MAENSFILGFFYGIVPAMGFLWIVMKEYHGFFSEKRLFRVFFVGLIAGLAATVLEQILAPTGLAAALSGATARSAGIMLLFAALLGILEGVMFSAVLNWKSFRGRRDTPFYGAAFGLGFGAMNALFMMGNFVRIYQIGATAPSWEDMVLFSLLGAFFMGSILVHGAMGVWIGRGTGVGPLRPDLARASAAAAAVFALFYTVFAWRSQPIWSNGLLVVGLGLGVALVHHVMTRVLDLVVPPEILREMGIHNRRLARRITREPPPQGPG